MNFAHLVADPTLPVPPKTSRKDQAKVEALREAYRIAMAVRPPRDKLTTPEAVAAYMAPIAAALSVECLWVIPLDAGSRRLSAPVMVSQGAVDGTDADPKMILRAALLAGAVTLALVHNHPSGDPTPSAADLACTVRICVGARAVGLTLVDHVVIGAAGSFASIRRQSPESFR